MIFFGRALLALIFLGAGYLKLTESHGDPQGSLPAWLTWSQSQGFIGLLAVGEITLGILLLTRKWRVATLACTALTASFAVYLFLLTAIGVDLRICSCFGPKEISPDSHFILLLGILAVCVAIIWLSSMGKEVARENRANRPG